MTNATSMRAVRDIAAMLTAHGQSLAVAESCTGGGLGWLVTSLPGCSAFFKGGVIAYENEAKSRLLAVPPPLIAAQGAVSEPVARCMAEQVRRKLRASFGVAITGVAGPAGGSKLKPVGTIWFAVAGPRRTVAASRLFRGSRRLVREMAVRHALRMLIDSVTSN